MSSTSPPRPAAEPRRRGLLRTLATALVLATAACGVGPQAHPVPVDEQADAAGGTTGSEVSRPVVVEVFLLRGSHLSPVSRVVSHRPGIAASLLALSDPLSETERYRQLHSALPSGEEPLTGTIRGSVARVSLPDGFKRLSVRNQVAAMAQIVYTVLANTSADAVQMYSGDTAVPVPTDDDAALREGPVRRSDYEDLAPVPDPTSVAR